MSRWSLASRIVGTGLACGAIALAPALADDKKTKEPEAGSSQGREAGEGNPEKRIDKVIEKYQSRADQDLEQTRKDIDRLQKELAELVALHLSLAVSQAELQAELRVQAADNNAGAGDNGSSSDKDSSGDAQDRQRLRTVELTRELRQVLDTLRNVVQQKRSETDQVVEQLRTLRAQQRQIASEREKNKPATDPSKD